MVLKKQNGTQRGQAVILAACICTGWVRLSGCLLGRRQVEKKNHRVNDFVLSVPLGILCALECTQCAYPLGSRE